MPIALSRFGLRRRFIVVLGGFVLSGSLVLLGVFHAEQRRESREQFSALARTNADFLGRTPLPRSPQMAGQLSDILKVAVVFRSADGALTTAPGAAAPEELRTLRARGNAESPVPVSGRREALVLPLSGGDAVCFVRETAALSATLTHPRVLGALLLFWLLALGLGAALARHLIRPLRALTERLPDLESGVLTDLPAAARGDEIGDLARALQTSQERLLTERRRREDAERMALLGRMATGLAHEVKNPVAAIRLHAQLLEREPGDPPPDSGEMCTGLAHILTESEKIESLVNQWCFLARPEPPVTVAADLGECAREVTAAAAAAALHAGVHLTFHPGPPLPVKIDRQRISQALTNLLRNALQATPAGGTADVRVEMSGADAIVTVTDSGSGFPDDALARFAEPFFSRKEGGIGLGLSLAAGAAQAHGGSLHARNAPGAVVILTLPLHHA